MISVETLDMILAIGEGELIEEIIITLLAAPQLAVFFEKFPRLKKAVSEDLPRWRDQLKGRLKDGHVPDELAQEVLCYQQSQLLTTGQLIMRLPEIIQLLHKLGSPFYEQAKTLVADNPHFTPAQHTLFLQRWRLSRVVQATSLNQPL